MDKVLKTRITILGTAIDSLSTVRLIMSELKVDEWWPVGIDGVDHDVRQCLSSLKELNLYLLGRTVS